MKKDPSLRSVDMTEGVERAAHRALFFSLGLNREDLGKPLIAVVNSWNEIVPGCVPQRQVAEAVKAGVLQAGGLPFEFDTIGVCDGMAQGHEGMKYSLPSREIISYSIEIMLQAHRFDGAVFLASCDKITPAMVMAAARVDIPSIIILPGAMRAGEHKGEKLTLSLMREHVGRFQAGKITEDELCRVEEAACPSYGSCSMIGTANTMACLCEVLGLAYPLSATTLASSSAKLREGRQAGMRIMELVQQNLRPSDILKPEAFFNAIKVSLSIGGSTNAVLHIPAMAWETGVRIALEDFDRLSREIPLISRINPSGMKTMNDFHDAGGIPAVFQALKSHLCNDLPTVCGKTIGEIGAAAEWTDREMIRPADRPFSPEGGLKVLYGSLAPNGSIVKKSGVKETMWHHRGPARVFDSMEASIEAVERNEVKPGSVIVIRYEGPAGGPGMREMHMITSIIVGSGLADNTALVTDGRFSGSTRGPCIGHVSPEAAEGGPLGLVKDGDMVSIDLEKGVLDLEVAADVLEERRKAWAPPKKELKGILKLYARMAPRTRYGAVWE